MRKSIYKSICVIAAIFMLGGCASNPDESIVSSMESDIMNTSVAEPNSSTSENIVVISTESSLESTTEAESESTQSTTEETETETEAPAFPVDIKAEVIGEHYIGESINASDIKVTVFMSDGSTLVNPEGWAVSSLQLDSDYNELTIAYGPVSSAFVIEARERETIPPATAPAKEGDYVVVLDPGHGGHDPGAINNTLVEKDMSLKVAEYCRAYLLENYTGITVYMTRDTDTYLEIDDTGRDLKTRCRLAASLGADAMIALHFNTNGGKSNGCLGLITGATGLSDRALGLSDDILMELSYLGLANLGSCITHNTLGGDYYAINRFSAELGMVGIIIEHCFIDNAIDVPFCDSEADIKALGEADARGIASYFSLTKK